MRKQTTLTFICAMLTLALTQIAIAQNNWTPYVVTNQTTETVYVTFSTWRVASGAVTSTGYRTVGFYDIDPGKSHKFYAYKKNPIYFQVMDGNGLNIKPTSDTPTLSSWVAAADPILTNLRTFTFNVVTPSFGNATREQISFTSIDKDSLMNADGFIKYGNGVRINITDAWVLVEDPSDFEFEEDDSGDTDADDAALLAPVNIPDSNLRAAIEEELGIARGAKITRVGMQSLWIFEAPNRNIQDLTGLEFATNLHWLDLYGNQITDLSPLTGLINLEDYLDLSENQISDVSPLANLKNLDYLYLSHNQIADLSPLANLTKLTELYIDGNQIADFSPIAGLIPNLEYYENSDQRVETVVDPNAPVNIPDPSLRTVIEQALGKASGATITARDMRTLTRLDARDRGIKNIVGLELATNLTELDLISNEISDVSPLARLTNLTGLGLSINEISDVSPLAELTNLRWLHLGSNEISDVSPLARLTNLTTLGLGENTISDVSPLAELTNLRWLHLNSNEISDVSPLAELTNLTRLDLNYNSISEVFPLAGLTNLTELSLRRNPISDASSLLGLPGLSARTKSDLMKWVSTCHSSMPHTHGQRLEPSTHAYTITEKSVSPKVSAHDGEVKFAPTLKDNATVNWTYETTVASESKHDPTTITVHFLNGERGANGVVREIDIVEEAARTWAQHGYLRFKFLYPHESGDSDIRVEFKYDYLYEVKTTKKIVDGVEVTEDIPTGKVVKNYHHYEKDPGYGWYAISPDDAEWHSYKPPSSDHYLKANSKFSSALGTNANDRKNAGGTDAKGFKNKTTMKFTANFTFGVALHEFGHALGLAHEHLSPKFKDYFKWKNTEDIYNYHQTKLSWTRGEVDFNILHTTPVALQLEGVDFDPYSIMTYNIQADWIEAQPNAPQWAKDLAANGIRSNHELSAADKKGISVLYPEPYPLAVDCEISVRAKDDDIGSDDWFDNRNNPDEFTVYHTHYSPTIEYLHKRKRTYITGGDKEVRVEVHVAVRNFRYSDETLELGVYALLYEEGAGQARTTDDLEDIACETVRIGLGDSKTITLDRLKNRCGVWNLKWKDTSCANLYKHGELYLGDASDFFCNNYSDWADVTVKLSVRSRKIIAVGIGAPSRVSVQDASSVDVNGDGQVDAADLLLVSNYIGQTAPANLPVDVNGDGSVTIADLVQVAQYLGQSTSASAPVSVVIPNGLTYETVVGWIHQARLEDDGSGVFHQGIAKLEYLLTLIIPEKTALLPNYPNPFNPETWIPYHLAEPAHVVLTIYSVDGKAVRRLDLGHQAAGYYQSQSRAAYWDGRNAVGERVASGLYFYTLTTGDFAATGKMLIMK